jgi:hypothetical protein
MILGDLLIQVRLSVPSGRVPSTSPGPMQGSAAVSTRHPYCRGRLFESIPCNSGNLARSRYSPPLQSPLPCPPLGMCESRTTSSERQKAKENIERSSMETIYLISVGIVLIGLVIWQGLNFGRDVKR